ncbi:ergosterol biosynthesis protein [Coemansia sp. RSA 1813]|nr:ergosterol biosynthesis protein [Coemansia sp. RSA 1646]KAJ1771771.1 ergosterol biosynthesis protein [Coemansia sp. RSA 1843]KAJ2093404.1 ergosterol biosynthesis protein [Coemansia sp. RSA 986]KAJ2217211.1 ergosterol biosynthesis protein [Coemansia sp. RSA 487]KAJ2572410.1 ergosterol biosynthesis protein [Coemansia sp. RSA 1813]
MLDALLTLPEGGLPKFIWLSAVFSVFNTVQCMVSPLGMTRKIYSHQPHQVTPLTSHVFAAWTALSAILRYKCAFNMADPLIYDLTFWSYVIAGTHFTSEIIAFKTVRFPGPVISTFCVALTSIIWMVKDRDLYIH